MKLMSFKLKKTKKLTTHISDNQQFSTTIHHLTVYEIVLTLNISFRKVVKQTMYKKRCFIYFTLMSP